MRKYLTSKELSSEYGLSLSFIYKCTSGRRILNFYKIGGKLLFLKEEVESLIMESKITTLKDCDLSIKLKK